MGTYKIQKRQHLTAVGKRRAELLHRNICTKTNICASYEI